MVDNKTRQKDDPISLGSSLDVLTPLQTKAFQLLPSDRSAWRQLFIENAPTDMLEFCVDRYENGNDVDRSLIKYVVNRHFGFSDHKIRNSEYWKQQDADYCEALQNCFDLVAVASRHLPLMTEAAVSLLVSMINNMRNYGIPVTRESQRSRYLVNVITYRLSSRTVIQDSYRNFISRNRESIEKNLDMILERKLYQTSDIRTIIDTHAALLGGSL